MALTTGAPSADPTRLLPDLVPYARTTVRLHPRRGTPEARGSHLGGPLWWPSAEPWPHCGRHQDVNGAPRQPYPLVAVAQLAAADFPEIAFPAGTDLAQVLWCPEWHDQPHPQGWGPACQVVWRPGAGVEEVLADQPDPEDHWEYESDMLPRACVLHPERLTEYPWKGELPEDLRERWRVRLEERNLPDDVSAVRGCKLGGSMDWSTTDMPPSLDCAACGAPLTLFLQFDTCEFDTGTGGPAGGPHRFWPLEERHVEPGTAEFDDLRRPTGMSVGRGSHGGLFVCSADPAHPPSFFTQ